MKPTGRKTNRTRWVAALTIGALVATATIAVADEVVNDVAVVASVKTATMTYGGTGVTVTYHIADSGTNNCDSNAGVTVTPDPLTNVTLSVPSISFTKDECSEGAIAAKSITFTGTQAGNYNVTHSIVAPLINGGIRSMTNQADFTLVVNKAAGSVSIDNLPASGIVGGSFTPTYTKAGDGTASTTSLSTSVCTVTSGTVNYIAAGACSLQASVTEGTNHLAATGAEQSFEITEPVATLTVDGFYAPVTTTANGTTPTASDWNTMKGGRTVPLKFEVFEGATEQTATSLVTSFRAFKVSCAGAPIDDGLDLTTEDTTTGSTSLRYDDVEGQFIQNWKTAKVTTDTCYRVEVKVEGEAYVQAYFKLTK